LLLLKVIVFVIVVIVFVRLAYGVRVCVFGQHGPKNDQQLTRSSNSHLLHRGRARSKKHETFARDPDFLAKLSKKNLNCPPNCPTNLGKLKKTTMAGTTQRRNIVGFYIVLVLRVQIVPQSYASPYLSCPLFPSLSKLYDHR